MADPENSESLPTQPWTGPAPAVGPAAPTPRASPAPSPQAGKWQPPTPEEVQPSFPQYEIRSLLGCGGMGAVYLGWQKSLDRLVAIKILPPQVEDTEGNFAERFKREAKALARFSHPGIVPVFDAGETPEGLLYFVMEYIEGTDLQKMVAAQGALAPEQALAIATEICGALAYAHERGVIHRDIKPSNIMVDAAGRVKVADFGLAKVISDDNAALLTHSHVRMGTPDFMAPEALQGMSLVDHRADLYAVGAMLYQMLTGELPRGRFELPSARRPGVDPRFDAIVDRAMQKDPEKRYSSATDLRSDLEHIRSQPALPSSLPPETAMGVGSDAAATSAPKRRRGKLSARLGGCSLTLALAFCVALVALPQLRELMVARVLVPQGRLAMAPTQEEVLRQEAAAKEATAKEAAEKAVADEAAAAQAGERKLKLNTAAKAAQDLEDSGHYNKSLQAWLDVAKTYPDFAVGKLHLETVLEHLRERPRPITMQEFTEMRPQITEATQLGVVAAMMLLADNVREREPETAFKWYSEAADRGLASGKIALGDCYLVGKGVKKDEAKALELFREAADTGDLQAMNRLGDMYMHGVGGKVDLAEAFRLFKKAADAGSLDALGNLGVLYVNGDTPEKKPDPLKAVALWKQGVEKENSFCMELYAAALEKGIGVKKDPEEARRWYIKAAEAGNPHSIEWNQRLVAPFNTYVDP